MEENDEGLLEFSGSESEEDVKENNEDDKKDQNKSGFVHLI